MAKSLSKTPAPKKDRIFGSDKNKKGSASSKASAKGIDLNDSIIETLTNKAKEYNEKHPNKRVSVTTLKAVMRRGMGAYSTSHRPTITGGAPNSRQAWGFARVNKFLKKKAGQQVKAAYVQDDDLMEKGGFIAPNGKTSNLTPEQYKLVRTPEFKEWFGDWENDPENASKVVDENGEPLVVYHGTYAKEKFKNFDFNKADLGFHFGTYEQANDRSKTKIGIKDYKQFIEPFFLNIRKLFVINDAIEFEYPQTYIGDLLQRNIITEKDINENGLKGLTIKQSNEIIRNLLVEKYNNVGFKYQNQIEAAGNSYIVCEPNQIKLADGTNKTFDMNNPDIRYADGGETKKSKDAYTIVAIYRDPKTNDYRESEDLTQDGLIGYRLRYNKAPMQYYGYVGYDNTESELERAKRDLDRYNKEAEEEKERKKLKDVENKIKREKQKIIDAQKLEAAKTDDSAKPAYLMTKSEYEDRVIPLLKEYEKFARKNSEYLANTSYSGLYKTTYEQVLSRALEGKNTGRRFDADSEKGAIRNWNYTKYNRYGDDKMEIPTPTPKDIVEKNDTFFNNLEKFFSDKVIFDSLDSEYKKSNKPEIRRAIEDDTYKKLLENGEITEEQVIKIAEEHGIKVPKRVFSQESNLKKEAKKQMDEILSKIPKMNKDVFDSLYNQLFEDFKDVEKVVFEREKERYEVLIKECIELSKKEGGINEDKLQSSISFWKLIFKESKSIAIYGKDSRGYPTSQYFQKNLELKSDYKPVMDKIILDYAESLKYRFLKSVLENFPKVSKPITNIEKKKIDLGVKGFEGRYRFNFADGSYFDFVTEAIPAAGYNIVAFHYRYLTHLENATLADGTKVKGYYEIMQKFSSDSMADGGQTGQAITCVNCGWHWNTADSEEFDKYICHKCGFDNRTFYDPEPIGVMADGGFIAPNGKPSNLTPEQYKLVRTPDFKAWFGDWENDPQNASKVVDDNGEPMVVYRSVTPKPISQGHDYIAGTYNYSKEGYQYFAKNKNYARVHGYITKDFFLNIRDILDFNYYNNILIENGIYADYSKDGIFQISDELEKEKPYLAQIIKVSNEIPDLSFEIKNKLKTSDGFYGYEKGFYGLEESYVVKNSNQIKLADGSNTTFDAANPDIRYADGGELDYTKDALEFFKKELGIKSDVVLVQSKSSFDPVSMSQQKGYTSAKKDNKFYVAVDFNETKNRFIRTLAHELVHVKQMEDERLRFEDNKIIFDDEKMTYDEYQKRYYSDDIPKFEDEAFNLERVLQNKYAEKEGSYADGGALGKSKVYYHGSNLLFKDIKFIPKESGESLRLGEGVYVTNDKEVAKKYGKYVYELISEEPLISLNYTSDIPEDELVEIIRHFENSDDSDFNSLAIDYQYKLDDGELMWGNSLISDLERYDIDVNKTLIELGYNSISQPINKLNSFLDWDENSLNINVIKPNILHIVSVKTENDKEVNYAQGGVMGQELFKPSKTIEQIAKEKDVPLEYAEEQLRKGMKTESEHSDNPMVQETIALQHLDEMIDYYEKLEYMESKDKMEKGGVTQFYKEYLDWYKDGVFNEMTIMVSVPNSFSKMSGGENDLILDVFEKKDENVDAKKKLTELLEIVDRNGLDVYLEPIPRLYNIKDKAKREKITREYLIKYYEKFGFELLPNGFMVRKHNKMEKGGQTISSTEKLISYLKENGVKKEGTQSTATDGTKYRYDTYMSKGDSAPNFLVSTFEKAAQENGNRYATRFSYKDTYSVAYDRPKYKGVSNGKIIMTELIEGDNMEKGGYYKAGGEINPDNKSVKDYFSHGSGNVGGVLVGKRHSEGGIKAVNKSTNQPLEMEGGEVVITRNAVSDNTKREFNGEMLTNREILSKINESGGGVSFADGGDIPETISTSGKEYKYGGKMMKDHEIVSSCGCNHSMAEGGLVYKKIYNRGGGGYTTIINGMEYSINKQYGKGTWVAQSDDGEYYKEAQTLSDLKYYLENLKKDSKDSYADGGETDYMISKKGNREYPEYVIERTDGSEMISMFFDSEKEAKDYADKKGYKITKKGYNMAEGGETDYHNEIKNHLFPKVEVEVEVEVEPEMDLIPINEHYITADDLGLSDGMPMLAVGTIIYSSGGNDQWEVVSFSDDGVNLVNNPKSPLQSKMEDKHLTFEELIKYFKDKAISIKNISTERELEPAIALVKNKLPQKSFAFGGFIDGDEDEDAKIMQSQFGKSNFK